MNKRRRDKLISIAERLEAVIEDEQNSLDNLSENMQESEKGEAMETIIDTLSEAKDLLEDVLSPSIFN